MTERIIAACQRCGTCCKNGGPGIHREDMPLIESGGILLKFLYTIRKGEPAHDNLANHIRPCETDIIKIKNADGSNACIFYDKNGSNCTIYANRPAECRVLKCWDTRAIRNMYDRNRLTRNDILAEIDGLWELVEDHQKRCSFEDIIALADKIKKTRDIDPELEKNVRYIIQYDLEIRSLVQRKGQVDPEMIEFFFGRPLIETLKSLGMNVRSQNGKIILSPA